MKKKLATFVVIAMLAILFAACGNAQTEPKQKQQDVKEKIGDFEDSTEAGDHAYTTEFSDTIENGDDTFAIVAHHAFSFSVGSGGWSTDFIIEPDGSFSGTFHASDMGAVGEGYENGTRHFCSFSGQFTNLTKINNNTYEMKMENLIYDNTPGEEEIADNVKYIYSEAYGLAGTDTFKLYLPGTPVSELTEEEYFWVRWANGHDGQEDTEEKLTIQVIVNEAEEYAMYAEVYDR